MEHNMIIEDQDCLKIVESFDKTGFNYTLSLVNGKYKLTILYAIYRHKIIRFNSLQKYLNIISHKTLSSTLKELENDNLIKRKVYRRFLPGLNIPYLKKENPLYQYYIKCASGAKNI